MRLAWLFEKYPETKKLAKEGKVQFGTLETWLIWKFTDGKTFAAEMSSASATGVYDPYQSSWSGILCTLLSFPMSIFPPVWDTNADYGNIEEKYFGAQIRITAPMGDQQAAFFGHASFEIGECKLTMGTGAFMSINVGNHPHASVKGFYPVTWYSMGNDIKYLAEGSANTCGDAIEWLCKLGFIDNAEDCEALAKSVDDTNGVYFVPAFNGLQAPTNDFSACGCLIGLNGEVSKAHIVRAVLQSLAFK